MTLIKDTIGALIVIGFPFGALWICEFMGWLA